MKRADPREIAKGLTKAQRDGVTNRLHGVRPNTWAVLERIGLIEDWRNDLSPLGQQVRTILENEHDD